jgi:NAD(P)H-hydrate epimerase
MQMNQEYRPLPSINGLPLALYRAGQVRSMELHAIETFGIAGETLMERAGAFTYEMIRKRWPDAGDITFLCGTGNNGGDGHVIARLAREEGLSVRILQLGDSSRMTEYTRTNAERSFQAGVRTEIFCGLPDKTDLIVDAMLGTGLDRPVGGLWAEAIQSVNRHSAPVVAVDIPSGLNADTGRIFGCAVEAEMTATFIALKQGMFTGQGPGLCGKIVFSSLEIPAQVYASTILSARRLEWKRQRALIAPRKGNAHKGDFGHVLIVGGAPGLSGAARLAGEAALRTGAGLVSVATHPDHAALMNIGCPELMCHGVNRPADLEPLLEKCDVVAMGPGLGQGVWGRVFYNMLRDSSKPVIMDADALNLLANQPIRDDNRIITPHPGEAARLLESSVEKIEIDRFRAVGELQAELGGVVVLKGAGSLVKSSRERPPSVCSHGNPGMATAGMGDVLTGMIAALVAQGLDLETAAESGVALHAAAADLSAPEGMRGMIASDLFPDIRQLLG